MRCTGMAPSPSTTLWTINTEAGCRAGEREKGREQKQPERGMVPEPAHAANRHERRAVEASLEGLDEHREIDVVVEVVAILEQRDPAQEGGEHGDEAPADDARRQAAA